MLFAGTSGLGLGQLLLLAGPTIDLVAAHQALASAGCGLVVGATALLGTAVALLGLFLFRLAQHCTAETLLLSRLPGHMAA